MKSNKTRYTFQDMARQEFIMKKGYGEITILIYSVGVWFLCITLPLTAIYQQTKFYINPFCTFQDMAQTHIHYEK